MARANKLFFLGVAGQELHVSRRYIGHAGMSFMQLAGCGVKVPIATLSTEERFGDTFRLNKMVGRRIIIERVSRDPCQRIGLAIKRNAPHVASCADRSLGLHCADPYNHVWFPTKGYRYRTDSVRATREQDRFRFKAVGHIF